MRRHARCLCRVLALIPLAGVYSVASCQADALRETANVLDDQANDLDREDPDLGDLLSEIVEDL